jgi:hypothetical protein
MSAAKKAKAALVSAAAADDGKEEELAETVKRISLDDFVRALPTGQSKISFAAKGGGSAAGGTSSKSN